LRGHVALNFAETVKEHNGKVLSKVSFVIFYEDGQYISSEMFFPLYASHIEILEGIQKYFKGELIFG
jgi:hypothetical protein